MIRRCFLAALFVAVFATACYGQVFQVAGAGSNVSGASGAAVGIYRENESTNLGFALQQGVHLGARREVSAGNATFALGDSTVELPLPSDLENTPRSFLARGLLLHQEAGGTLVFAGYTGAATSNSFASSVLPSRFVGVLSSTIALGHDSVSTLLTRGVCSNTLVSVSHERNPFWRAAVTVGRSGSHGVVRTLLAMQGATFHLAVSENLGDLQLQPSVGNQGASLERIGLNVIASRSFGRHWTVDGARHNYSTLGVGQSVIYQGVTARTSELLEGGVTLHAGSLQAQGRVLDAVSGSRSTEGSLVTAAWTAQRWSLQSTLLQSRTADRNAPETAATTRSADVQAAQQVWTRLRLEETASFGGNSTSVSLGGSWTGDRFGVSVSHHQMFVPFGTHSGFQSVVLVSARLRIRGSEAAATVTRGGGLPTTVLLSTDGYYGAVQDAAVPQDRPVRLPRFIVQGHVRTPAGEPIRGAAVRIASTVVYTDSDGQFLARFDRDRALVPVRLLPEQFLSAQNFRDRSGEQWIRPTHEGGDVLLAAERCSSCALPVANAAALPDMQSASATGSDRQSVLLRTMRELRLLTVRMFAWRRTSKAAQA